MKNLIIGALLLAGIQLKAQSIVGTWQLTDEKTCFESDLKESETEKELLKDMGSSKTAVAKVIKFDKKGSGEDGVFATGKKKGADKSDFDYKLSGKELLFLDKKSGIITQSFTIDEFTETTLKIHNSKKDCEVRTFTRIK